MNQYLVGNSKGTALSDFSRAADKQNALSEATRAFDAYLKRQEDVYSRRMSRRGVSPLEMVNMDQTREQVNWAKEILQQELAP